MPFRRSWCWWLLAAPAAAWDPDFAAWYDRFDRSYEGEEKQQREAVFLKNRAFIAEHNRGNHTYELGLNGFSDLTSEEFGSYLGYDRSLRPSEPSLGVHRAAQAESLASTVDWRAKGAVTPVKNQGQCGSCWAFSSTGALEGAWQIASGKLASISEQQLVDCAKLRYFNMGCQGGRQSNAFRYTESHAMCTEDAYPYEAKSGLFKKCKADGCDVAVPDESVTGYKTVDSSADALQSAVAQQPVAVAIEADQTVFQHYKSGVITDSACGSTLDHAVLVVGYGTDAGNDYWIVKNSWGAAWGEDGYVRLVRGKNECGILNGPPLYPVVQKPSILI